MGRHRRYKPKKNFAEKRREKLTKKDDWDREPHRSYSEIIRENKDFESYYRAQKIVSDHEWNSFIQIMKEDLPTAFRITGSTTETKTLLKIIQGDFFNEIVNTDCSNDTNNVSIDIQPHCLPFYPQGLGWQLQISRKNIRRSEHFFKLHNFLIAETNGGNISRQEVVSMVPPLVLDVKPWHKVLDMCAAPGSKTAQLIEMIHANERIPIPEGFVIANDLDNNRCYMLVHQAKRLNSPNILITNHDASVMPNFTVSKSDGDTEILKYDSILADFPCILIFTMRKNPDIWSKWNPANGNNLHGIQYRIAKRGIEMLAVGGKMVYSTCSLNPIENEAVLHRLISEADGSVELEDCKDLVPGLIHNPGVTHWLPAAKNLQYFHCWEDVPEELKTQIRPKMFPPAKKDSAKYNLDKCMRILPHHQNTGGFFVAVLKKLKLLPWENNAQIENSVREQSELYPIKEIADGPVKEEKKKNFGDTSGVHEPQRKRKKLSGYREDPFIFFNDENEDVWPSIREFYSISDKLHPQCLLVRCREGKRKNIYLTSPQIRDIIINNEDHIKMINTGVKTFVRCDNKNMQCAFRLAQEGLKSIIHYVGEHRKIQVSRDDIIMLLQNINNNYPPEITKLAVETQEKLKSLVPGSCILIYEENNVEKIHHLKFEIVGWRGTISLRVYIPVCDTIHYLRLLEEDFSMFEKNKFQLNRNEETKKSEEKNS
ncbi:tRNA (cytosine(34)-C(5))-methyltransferase [Copidosoma floridanum]|uniref:tRNA (cytosine(34)-C(5))-methyltransferase n=1 Tax=Copidosoma floridanum TaxID=29053 RepID=UPI000C6F62D8|nr:tRNA (cytosine(34)-C(5))-methyltransferase [Copidosoma floridanum]